MTVLSEKLEYKQISASVLHSDLNKMERQNSLRLFRQGKTPMLLATDVAARGLDIQGIPMLSILIFQRTSINMFIAQVVPDVLEQLVL